MSRRYAIAHHTGAPRGDHYDIFLEREEDLWTWSAATLDWREPRPLEPRDPHRKIYLEYEGQISGGRGCVTMSERGTYEIESAEETRWILRLRKHGGGERLVEFRRGSDGWEIVERCERPS